MVSNGVQFHVSFPHACLRFVSDLCYFCRSWPCQEETVPSLIRLGTISPDKVTGALAAAFYVLASARIGCPARFNHCGPRLTLSGRNQSCGRLCRSGTVEGPHIMLQTMGSCGRRYRGGTTEYCKTWAPVGGGTEVGPQNAAKRGILWEAVPRRDHRMLQNVGSCGRRY